jgi:hypothetical protein
MGFSLLLGSDGAPASAAVLGLRLGFDAEHELELCIEARFYYARPVPLRRELTRCPDAQPVPRRAAASFNQALHRMAAQRRRLTIQTLPVGRHR